MKTNYLYAKIKSFFVIVWHYVREAFRPDWASTSSPNDTYKEEVSTAIANVETLASVIADNDSRDVPCDCTESTDDQSLEEMRQYEEIVRLQKMIESLEKSLAERSTVQDVLIQLKSIAEQKKKHKRGRPPKPHVKVLLDLYEEWSLLYELGVLSRQIKWNRTEFVNSAVEYTFKTEYPELYAVYLRSISDAPSEFVSLGDEDDIS